ncbi:DNA oxidative demethylase ALKBH2-like [Styela clava]
MTVLYSKNEADAIFREIEDTVEYNTGKLAKVQMYGKWINIPRKQTAFGDEGLTYTFSGNTIPAKPWPPYLLKVKNRVEHALSDKWIFNFVLINYYKDGNDHIGEHRDNEKDLDRMAPIASLSLGQTRDFVFRHKDARGGQKRRKDLKSVTVPLTNGCLFVMNPPTNDFWYHSLPVRKRASFPRINLTFRVMKQKTEQKIPKHTLSFS